MVMELSIQTMSGIRSDEGQHSAISLCELEVTSRIQSPTLTLRRPRLECNGQRTRPSCHNTPPCIVKQRYIAYPIYLD
jgi:hypothetical protein